MGKNLFLIIPLLLLFSCSSSKNNTTKIIIASDLHYISPRINDNGEYFQNIINKGDGKLTTYCDEIMKAFTDDVIKEKPKALIVSGDLTFNGAKASHQDLSLYFRAIEEHNIPVYIIPGNHDINNTAYSYVNNSHIITKGVNKKVFKEIYNEFGFDESISYDTETLSYFSDIDDNTKLLMLDFNNGMDDGTISKNTLNWIENRLEETSQKRVIVVSHQNLLQHNSLFYEGFVASENEEIITLLKKYNINYSFSGHLHIQSIKTDNDFTEIATSALTVTPAHYGIIKINQNETVYETKNVNVSGWAKKNNLTDKNLLDFNSYIHDFFYNKSYDSAYSRLGDSENKEEMAKYYAEINTLYFEGKNEQIIANNKLLDEWKKQNSFMSAYIESIVGKKKS